MDVRYFANGRQTSRLSPEQQEATTPKPTKFSLEDTPEKVSEPVTSAHDEETVTLQGLVSSKPFLVLSLPSCPQCDELAAMLSLRGVPESVWVKWDKGSKDYPALKAALAVYAGDRFSFPQVFMDGVYQGGFSTVVANLEQGAYDEIFQREFHVTPSTVQRLVEGRPMVVFSLPNCPQCDDLRSLLELRGLPVAEIFVKWDKSWPQYQSLKAQLIKLIGQSQFTFPQTFVQAEYQGSFYEVQEKLEVGHIDQFFCDAFGIALPAVPAMTEEASASFSIDEDF